MADIIYPLVQNSGQTDVPKIKYKDQGDGTQAMVVAVVGGSGGGGGAATVADGADVTQGSVNDALIAAGAAGTLNAHARAISRDMGTVAANLPAKGQAAMAASLPVTIASDQSPLTVTGSVSTTAVTDLVASGSITTQNLNATGVATAGSAVTLALNGTATVALIVSANTLSAAINTQLSVDGTTWTNTLFYATSSSVQGTGSSNSIAATVTGQYQYIVAGYKYFRVVATTAVTGSATVTLNGSTAFAPFVQSVNLATLNNASGSQIAFVNTPGGAAATAMAVAVASSAVGVDYNTQAWTAVSGSGAIIVDQVGAACSFDVNVSAFVAGSSTGLDIFLQWSPDSGTTWYDLWQCETFTAAGHAYIPAMQITGRRRVRWVNRGGVATTATVTITSNRLSLSPAVLQRQFFDRTATVINGSAALASTAAYDIGGCKLVTASITVVSKATTTDPTYQLQTSADGVNWASVGSPTTTLVVGTNDLVFASNTKRFARVIVVTAGTGTAQVGSVVALTASN